VSDRYHDESKRIWDELTSAPHAGDHDVVEAYAVAMRQAAADQREADARSLEACAGICGGSNVYWAEALTWAARRLREGEK
jgi:hypothetical protein